MKKLIKKEFYYCSHNNKMTLNDYQNRANCYFNLQPNIGIYFHYNHNRFVMIYRNRANRYFNLQPNIDISFHHNKFVMTYKDNDYVIRDCKFDNLKNVMLYDYAICSDYSGAFMNIINK